MQRTAVINVVGLTARLLGSDMPRLQQFLQTRRMVQLEPAFPAVTCTAQSNYLTGLRPAEHGIVGNGWYHRELAEVQFWKQSNHVVLSRKIWDDLRDADPAFTCAKLFWWYNMYARVDYSITPRPMYPADGRKVFDVYTWPYQVRYDIKQSLGEFPFFSFWGPRAGIASSQWIAQSARWIEEKFQPTLSLVYLPHLDYNLQRLGPNDPAIRGDLTAIDTVVGDLLDFYAQRSVSVLVLSEYGITAVRQPVHLNRLFREKGWLAIKEELGLELLDCGASKVFAVADHQVAHVYLNDPTLEPKVKTLLESTPGVESVLGKAEQIEKGIHHPRCGDLVAVASPEAWFTYYYWLDDAVAPDFARTVDIHRKPGYDPVELFASPGAKARVAFRLLQKKLGFRMLMDVIPLEATLVKGSHGRIPEDTGDWPVLMGDPGRVPAGITAPSTAVFDVIKQTVLG